MTLALTSLTLLALIAHPFGAPREDRDIDDLRQLYVAAVQDESAIEPALELVRQLRSAPHGSPLLTDATLLAYEGGIISLRAKHGWWPNQRLAAMRHSLELLDRAVADEPANPEVRYLRLMTCYYLPAIFGRKRSVSEDFAALAKLLPHARRAYPADVYRAVGQFVLESGQLSPSDAAALREAVRSAAAGG